MSSQFNLLLLGCFILGLHLCRNRVLPLDSFLAAQELLVLNFSTLIQTADIVLVPLETLLELLLFKLRIQFLSCMVLRVLTLDGLLMCLRLSLGDLLCDRQISLYPALTLLLLQQSLLVYPTLLLDAALVIYEPTLNKSQIRLEMKKDLPFAVPLSFATFRLSSAHY